RTVQGNIVADPFEIVGSVQLGDQLNQVRLWFTVHRRVHTLGVERVLTSRPGHTDQVPPSFCTQTKPSQAPVPVLSRSLQQKYSWGAGRTGVRLARGADERRGTR